LAQTRPRELPEAADIVRRTDVVLHSVDGDFDRSSRMAAYIRFPPWSLEYHRVGKVKITRAIFAPSAAGAAARVSQQSCQEFAPSNFRRAATLLGPARFRC